MFHHLFNVVLPTTCINSIYHQPYNRFPRKNPWRVIFLTSCTISQAQWHTPNTSNQFLRPFTKFFPPKKTPLQLSTYLIFKFVTFSVGFSFQLEFTHTHTYTHTNTVAPLLSRRGDATSVGDWYQSTSKTTTTQADVALWIHVSNHR